jgi:dTDP-4-dehydrorhamnose 3,5-epimerase
MNFIETGLPGALLITPEKHGDERGYFARMYCQEEFAANGITFAVRQVSTSFNAAAGTLRGMHFQAAPKAEAKLVRCTAGRIFDVIIDLRKESPTYCRWYGVQLSVDNCRALYVPENFAHGFLTLAHDSEVLYFMNEFYDPGLAGGVRWNDPAFAVNWPQRPAVIADKDTLWPEFTP